MASSEPHGVGTAQEDEALLKVGKKDGDGRQKRITGDRARHSALKARHRELREKFPTALALRTHRALSWLHGPSRRSAASLGPRVSADL